MSGSEKGHSGISVGRSQQSEEREKGYGGERDISEKCIQVMKG